MSKKVKLKDYLDTNKIFKIYGISPTGTSVLARTVKLSTYRGYWDDRARCLMKSLTKNGNVTATDTLSLDVLDNDKFNLYNYIYFLDPKIPYSMAIDRIRLKKRELDKKQLAAQIELAKYGKED